MSDRKSVKVIDLDSKEVARFGPMLIVGLAVLLQIASILVLKTVADRDQIGFEVLVLGIMGAGIFHVLRILVWMFAHQHYPLSSTYPLTSMLYPLMLFVAYLYGDTIGPNQWIGTALITAGVIWLTVRTKP